MAVSHSRGNTLVWFGVILATFFSLTGQASQVYVESVTYAWSDNNYNPDSDSFSGTGPAGVSSVSLNPGPYARGASAASAGGGSLATVSQASLMGPDYSDQMEAVAEALARTTIDDLVFTGAGSSVTTSLNMSWSGLMTETLIPGSFSTYGIATNTLSISGRIYSGTTTYLEFSGDRIVSIEQEDPITFPTEIISTSGIIDGNWPPNGDLETELFTVPTNTLLSFELSLFSRSTVGFYLTGSAPIEGEAFSKNNFGDTLSLSTSGSVFNLGPGEDASSVSASIDSNVWTGTPVSASVVPIPASIYLFISGLLMLTGVRLKKTSSR